MIQILKHTLVMHLSPDLEALFMGWLIAAHESVREALGVVDHPKLKFIPAGPLRKEDWPGNEALVTSAILTPAAIAAKLEEQGYQFLDCGRGSLDQHGRPENENRNSVSSLDLLVWKTNLDALFPHLMPIVAIISDNDLTGQDIAPKRSWKESETPHTPRQLRNMIQGWNLLNKENPAKVFSLASTAFSAISLEVGAAVVDAEIGVLGEEEAPKYAETLVASNPDLVEAARAKVDFRAFFLADHVVAAVHRHFAAVYGLDAEAEIAIASDGFRKEADAALTTMEKEWEVGVQDYWNASRDRDVFVAVRASQGVRHDRLVLTYGRSASTRFGMVTRYGNNGHGPDAKGRPRRAKADITIQFYGDGRFVIATRGLELDRVATALREADFRKRGVNVRREDRQLLARPGHVRLADQAGRPCDALFFAEYRTNFGNAFRANPFAERTRLTMEEVVDITVKALARAD